GRPGAGHGPPPGGGHAVQQGDPKYSRGGRGGRNRRPAVSAAGAAVRCHQVSKTILNSPPDRADVRGSETVAQRKRIRWRPLRLRGLQHRWLFNTVMPVFLVLALVAVLVSVGISSYFYGSMQ